MAKDNIRADRHSLWSLLENETIVIPSYQREYAHGRQKGEAIGIRKALVGELIHAVDSEKQIELNFVYGGKVESTQQHDSVFHLVDGQQRLTTLFLLHWYVFIQAEEPYSRLKSFRYSTRSSSNNFCIELLKLDKPSIQGTIVDGNMTGQNEAISKRIMDKTWFTGAMFSDPTVQSMLVVLDEIEAQFAALQNTTNWKEYTKRLRQDAELCPIVFLGLNMEKVLGVDESAIRDLYIKMNSRGKLLTDFEIFKSLISKREPLGTGKFDLLAHYFARTEKKDTNQSRIETISRFNCDYADAFFKVVDGGKIIDYTGNCQTDYLPTQITNANEIQNFDKAMMCFVNEIFRLEYVLSAFERGVKRREYEKYYNEIKRLNGKDLFSWIEKHGHIELKNQQGIYEDQFMLPDDIADEAFTKAFESIDHIFSLISDRAQHTDSFSFFTDNTCLIDESLLIDSLAKDDPSLQSVVRRYATFLYWDKIFKDGIPQDKTAQYGAYKAWARFVYNMTFEYDEDDLYKAIENLCQECLFFKGIVARLAQSETQLSESLIYETIASCNYQPAARFEMQLGEEKEKAKLILQSSTLKHEILETERYYTSSRIWPLLELTGLLETSEEVHWEALTNGFVVWRSILEELFDKDYKLKIKPSSLFERALLCMEDNTEDQSGHLEKTDMFSFLGDDYRKLLSKRTSIDDPNRHAIILALIRRLKNATADSIPKELEKVIQENKSTVSSWKKAFIDYFEFCSELRNQDAGGFHFTRGIMPFASDPIPYINNPTAEGPSYTLIYTAAKKRTTCAELLSFILAREMSATHDVMYRPAHYHESCLDEAGLPRRYFTVDGVSVYYYNGPQGKGFYNGDRIYLGATVETAKASLEAK